MPDKTISEAEGTLGSLLRRPYECLQDRVYARLAERGFADVRPAHSNVFRYVLGQGSRVSDLAVRAQMTKQSMAYLAQSLADLGYVGIGPDPTDGRAKLVVLTERGMAVSRLLVRLSGDLEVEIGASIGEARLAELRDLLAQVITVLEEV